MMLSIPLWILQCCARTLLGSLPCTLNSLMDTSGRWPGRFSGSSRLSIPLWILRYPITLQRPMPMCLSIPLWILRDQYEELELETEITLNSLMDTSVGGAQDEAERCLSIPLWILHFPYTVTSSPLPSQFPYGYFPLKHC